MKLELKGAVDQITKLTEANKYADSLLQRIQDFTLTNDRAEEVLRPTETENPPHKNTQSPKSSQHKDQVLIRISFKSMRLSGHLVSMQPVFWGTIPRKYDPSLSGVELVMSDVHQYPDSLELGLTRGDG